MNKSSSNNSILIGSSIFFTIFLIVGFVILPTLNEFSESNIELVKENQSPSGGNTAGSGDNRGGQIQENSGNNALGQQ